MRKKRRCGLYETLRILKGRREDSRFNRVLSFWCGNYNYVIISIRLILFQALKCRGDRFKQMPDDCKLLIASLV